MGTVQNPAVSLAVSTVKYFIRVSALDTGEVGFFSDFRIS